MLVVGFFQWWYLRGWKHFARKTFSALRNLADSFSISLLLRTLFAPYKQISAYGSGGESVQAQFGDFFDKLLSRMIGFIMRLLIIFVGIIVLTAVLIIGLIAIAVWPLLPILPLASVILTIAGITF